MNRRDFLLPHLMTQGAGDLLEAEGASRFDAIQSSSPEIALVRSSRRAMATLFEVLLPYGAPEAAAAAQAALDVVDQVEEQLSVYRDTSEVSRINRLAAREAVSINADLFSLLQDAARITRATQGGFDITSGPLIKAWGFYARSGRLPSAQERVRAHDLVGMRHVVLNAHERTVRYSKEGVEINLGSIGKGYALDRAAAALNEQWGLQAALLHGGHSSVHALGAPLQDGRGWPVGIRHPWDPARRLAIIRLCDQGMATSAATFQHLEWEGRKLGHILDPRTGWPAEGMASVSVVAPTAAEADALATAFFVLGLEAARDFCASRSDVGAVILEDGSGKLPVILGLGPDVVTLLR